MCFFVDLHVLITLDGGIYAHPIEAPKGRHNLTCEQFINRCLVCSFDFGCFEMNEYVVLILPANNCQIPKILGHQ